MRPGVARKSPGRISSVFTSTRLSATRLPASATSTGLSCICTERMRHCLFWGRISTVSPGRTSPLHRVPVMTVPAPRMLNTRSTGWRMALPRCSASAFLLTFASAARTSSTPSPVRLEQGTMGASANGVVASRARTSSVTSSTQSGSHRSILVSATTQVGTPSVCRTARCSRVWGMTPSSAAMTSRATSMPVDPAIIWRTNFS